MVHSACVRVYCCVSLCMVHTVHIPMYIFVVTLHLSCHLQCGMYVACLLSVLLVFDCVLTLDLCI